MKLITDWKSTLTGAWSIRLLILAAVISVLPVFIALVSPDLLGLDPLIFAAIAAGVNLIAIPARVMVQPTSSLWARFRRDESGAVRKKTVGVLAAGGVALASAVTFIGDWEGLRTTAYRAIVGVCLRSAVAVYKGHSRSSPKTPFETGALFRPMA
mgnify:CR=1 FL=1